MTELCTKGACGKLPPPPPLHIYWFVGWNLSSQQVTPIGHQEACAVFRLVWTVGPCRVCSSVIGVQEEGKQIMDFRKPTSKKIFFSNSHHTFWWVNLGGFSLRALTNNRQYLLLTRTVRFLERQLCHLSLDLQRFVGTFTFTAA